MKIIHRYILKDLFYYFGLFLLLFCTILIAKEMYETRDEILDESPAFVDLIQYIALLIPSQVVEAIPLITMFASLFALGLLARNREILAMVAAGMSFRGLAMPVALFGTCAGLLTLFLTDGVAPEAQKRARYLYEVRIKGKNQFAFTGNDEIFSKGEGRRFYIMANFDPNAQVMSHPTIFVKNVEGNGLAQRIEADEARLVVSEESGEKMWEFTGMQRWSFHSDGEMDFEEFDVPVRLLLEEDVDNFLAKEERPEEMTSRELKEYLGILIRQGGGTQVPIFKTALHAKYSEVAACLLLAVVGFAAAVDLRRRNFVIAFTIGLGMGIGFYVLREITFGLGRRDYIMPLVAAWAPCLVFAGFVAWQLERLRAVR